MSDKLKKNLKELQNELKQIESPSPKLKQLAKNIDEVLDQAGDASHQLMESFQHATEEFEMNHPQLTALVNNITTALSNAGI